MEQFKKRFVCNMFYFSPKKIHPYRGIAMDLSGWEIDLSCPFHPMGRGLNGL
jgi:hypothetical protein